MIKSYLDKEGNPQEQIFEVSWAGGRRVDANGKLPAIADSITIFPPYQQKASIKNVLASERKQVLLQFFII